MLEDLREEFWRQHMELPKNNRATWISGNVSGRNPETNLVVIKPSVVRYEVLQPQDMDILGLEGKQVEGKYKPSSDTARPLYIYRQSRCPNCASVTPPWMGSSSPSGTGK